MKSLFLRLACCFLLCASSGLDAVPAFAELSSQAKGPPRFIQVFRALMPMKASAAVPLAAPAPALGPETPVAEAPKTPAPPAEAAKALFDGERAYAAEPGNAPLDANTIADLELFSSGHGLHAIVDKTQTAFGSNRLKWLLSHPYQDTAEIRRRQQAVSALRESPRLGEAVDASFARLSDKADGRLWRHFRENRSKKSILFISTVLGTIPLFLSARVLFGHQGILSGPALPLIQVYFYSLMGLAGHLADIRQNLLRYKAVFRLARELHAPLEASASPALREIGAVFRSVDDRSHPLGLAGLAARLRRTLPLWVGVPLDMLFLHGSRSFWLVSGALRRRREPVARLLGALSELDAYRQWAKALEAKPAGLTFPEPLDSERASLKIEGGHHPLLVSSAERRSVPNDVHIAALERFEASLSWDKDANFLVLTGANMGGKSTFLRMLAVLSLLAMAGAPVPAKAMALTPFSVLSSIDIADDLKSGKSFFDAETDRILQIIKRAAATNRLLVVMDEILQGTNPEERRVAEKAIISYLGRTGNLFLLATHDRAMTLLEGVVPGVRNVHVEERIEDGKMLFSHQVLPGPATTRNAIAILEMKGYPAEIVEPAKEDLKNNPPQ